MGLSRIYTLLNNPVIYGVVQKTLAAGADKKIVEKLTYILEHFGNQSPNNNYLDVGCGPKSWLSKIGLNPVGLDAERSYVDAYVKNGGICELGCSTDMPFKDQEFDGVWSIGVFHHLSDEMVSKTLDECLRVCKKGGFITILDAVLPREPLRDPLASLIRYLDRGKFMRTENELVVLLPERIHWEVQRFRYSKTGLEMASLVGVKQN